MIMSLCRQWSNTYLFLSIVIWWHSFTSKSTKQWFVSEPTMMKQWYTVCVPTKMKQCRRTSLQCSSGQCVIFVNETLHDWSTSYCGFPSLRCKASRKLVQTKLTCVPFHYEKNTDPQGKLPISFSCISKSKATGRRARRSTTWRGARINHRTCSGGWNEATGAGVALIRQRGEWKKVSGLLHMAKKLRSTNRVIELTG